MFMFVMFGDGAGYLKGGIRMVYLPDRPGADIVARFLSGESLRKISASTGLSRQHVRRLVVEAGESICQHHAVELPNDPSWWVDHFVAGHSVADLAKRMNTNQMHVYRHLRAIRVPSPRSQPLESWLAARTKADGECLRWRKSSAHGRPSATYAGSHHQSVRRILWEHTYGAVPEGSWVISIPDCPHPDCVAVAHIRLITPDQHVAERVQARRFRWGEKHGNAKLTTAEARSILEQRTAHPADLAAHYKVSKSTIQAIWAGRRWAHLN
ncbi:hypothetical protein [Microbacterium maritypicum]|uniref:hypothetical protein n=1 Tax=Microbacterium maritypicum TaxID=33918 RepID=UPI0037FE7C02